MKIVRAVAQQHVDDVVVKYTGRVPFIFIFLFLDTCTAFTREPISTHKSSKDADWLKEVPLESFFSIFSRFGGQLPPKTPEFRHQ